MSRVMVITEKPTAAKRIAHALDENQAPTEVKKRSASYYDCRRGNDDLIVVYALGHLFELKQTEKGWTYPRMETSWVPKYEVEKKATQTKPIINLIKRLSKDVDSFVVATDYDIEGSLIGYLTLKYACKADPKRAQRMFFSSLTDSEIQNAYDNMSNTLDFPMIEAGQVRHEIDWLYGINLTRALTLSVKNTAGWFKIVSTGRVQGPTLSYVAEREQKINLFVPLPFWVIHAKTMHNGVEIELEYSKKRIDTKSDAETIAKTLDRKTAHVDSINSRTTSQQPHPPFNLSTLQSEAYRHFGFKPSRTLAVAQSLYLDALISYPRTSSEKLPQTLDLKEILNRLGKMKSYTSMVKQVVQVGNFTPVQGKKTDPAHPAIHPTGTKPTKRLTPSEKKLFDLIVRRFLALFGEPAVKEHLRADIKHEEHALYLRGLRILKQGWMEFYGSYAKTNERELPEISEGDPLLLHPVNNEEKFTQPPARFNPASLLKLLERENLGTKATRARIVDSIKSRGYTLNDRFELSTLGYALFETLEKYLPDILSPELTRYLEKEMNEIQQETTNREDVLTRAKDELLELLENFKSQEEEIGNDLVTGLQRYWKSKEELGKCPTCRDGTLRVIRSAKTGKRFVGCSNYSEGKCDQTFPLPQKGDLSPLDKTCEHCGYQMFQVTSGRRKWETCINWTECPGRKDELKALEERRTKQTEKTQEDAKT
ncbi:MAG: DNA topoisomerase 1 [Candidatus Thorarchaeota archaeon AB_25]|nr:MAG: DNA topoisomerase 1 [Candidatus Thorarchaeota archaeon AB_25]